MDEKKNKLYVWLPRPLLVTMTKTVRVIYRQCWQHNFAWVAAPIKIILLSLWHCVDTVWRNSVSVWRPELKAANKSRQIIIRVKGEESFVVVVRVSAPQVQCNHHLSLSEAREDTESSYSRSRILPSCSVLPAKWTFECYGRLIRFRVKGSFVREPDN